MPTLNGSDNTYIKLTKPYQVVVEEYNILVTNIVRQENYILQQSNLLLSLSNDFEYDLQQLRIKHDAEKNNLNKRWLIFTGIIVTACNILVNLGN